MGLSKKYFLARVLLKQVLKNQSMIVKSIFVQIQDLDKVWIFTKMELFFLDVKPLHTFFLKIGFELDPNSNPDLENYQKKVTLVNTFNK